MPTAEQGDPAELGEVALDPGRPGRLGRQLRRPARLGLRAGGDDDRVRRTREHGAALVDHAGALREVGAGDGVRVLADRYGFARQGRLVDLQGVAPQQPGVGRDHVAVAQGDHLAHPQLAGGDGGVRGRLPRRGELSLGHPGVRGPLHPAGGDLLGQQQFAHRLLDPHPLRAADQPVADHHAADQRRVHGRADGGGGGRAEGEDRGERVAQFLTHRPQQPGRAVGGGAEAGHLGERVVPAHQPVGGRLLPLRFRGARVRTPAVQGPQDLDGPQRVPGLAAQPRLRQRLAGQATARAEPHPLGHERRPVDRRGGERDHRRAGPGGGHERAECRAAHRQAGRLAADRTRGVHRVQHPPQGGQAGAADQVGRPVGGGVSRAGVRQHRHAHVRRREGVRVAGADQQHHLAALLKVRHLMRRGRCPCRARCRPRGGVPRWPRAR